LDAPAGSQRGWDQWQLAQLPELHVLQLAPEAAELPRSPETRAEKTDIRRRRLREPHAGQARPLPLAPYRQSLSNT